MRCAIGLSMVLLAVSACMPRGPVLDTSEGPAGVGGTISGTVRASADAIGLVGRKVTDHAHWISSSMVRILPFLARSLDTR